MLDIKQIAREFVVGHYGVRESFFQAAWDISSSDRDAAISVPRRSIIERPSIIGEERHDAVLAVMIFVDASKNLGSVPKTDDLVAAIQAAASKYDANERLLREILDYVRREKTVPQPLSRKRVLLWTNEFGVFLGPLEIETEVIEDYLARKDGFEILIVDNGQSVSRKVGDVYLKGASISEKQIDLDNRRTAKLSAAGYRLLVHLLKGNGDGGTYLDIAKAVWFYDEFLIEGMQANWYENETRKIKARDPFEPKYTKRIKKEKTILRQILRATIEKDLDVDTSYDISHHVMKNVPKFCFIEIRMSRGGART